MKDTMILKDGTVIDLEAGASLSDIRVASTDRAAMVTTWAKLTEANLAEVTIKNDAGLVCGTYTDLVLMSETSTVASDGSVLTSYKLREKTDTDKRLDALETGQEVLVGAVSDLGAATSAISEQLEGGEA